MPLPEETFQITSFGIYANAINQARIDDKYVIRETVTRWLLRKYDSTDLRQELNKLLQAVSERASNATP